MNLFLALLSVSDDAVALIQDALANHGYVVAAIAAVIFLVPLVLKAFGKSIPVLDPILEVALSVLRAFSKPKDAAKLVPPEEAAKQEGLAAVVEIKPLSIVKPQDPEQK